MLGNLRMSQKLQAMVAIAVLGIAAVAVMGLLRLKNDLVEDRKAKVRDLVQVVQQMLVVDHENAVKSGLSEDEAKARAKAIIRGLHFGKDDDFYAVDSKGVNQAHPNPKLEVEGVSRCGTSRTATASTSPASSLRPPITAAGSSAIGFPAPWATSRLPRSVTRSSSRPSTGQSAPGVYLDDVDAIFWAEVWRTSLIILVILAVVVAASVLLSQSMAKPLAAITAAMRQLAAGDKAVALIHVERRDEIGKLAQSPRGISRERAPPRSGRAGASRGRGERCRATAQGGARHRRRL